MTEYFNEWGQEPLREPDSVFDNVVVTPPSDPSPQPDGPVVLAMSEVVDRIKGVLGETQVLQLGPGHEVVFTESNGWDLRGAPDDMVFSKTMRGGRMEWEVQCSEETFWSLCAQFLGPQGVREMKQDLEDLLRWEGEGGPCLG